MTILPPLPFDARFVRTPRLSTRCGIARPRVRVLFASLLLVGCVISGARARAGTPEQPRGASQELLAQLQRCPFKIIHESHKDGNWEFYVMNADGSDPVNLTRTPDIDELYPKVSPDGSKIAFQADTGRGENKVRNLYLMNVDGTGRIKIADQAREPCWSADGREIAYLPNELRRFTYADGATKGIRIYNLATGQTRAHPNNKIEHLYTLNWSPNGKWFIATCHGGMGFKHSILALQVDGDGVFNLGLGGCRPDINPAGTKVAWGDGDYAMGCVDVDLTGPVPKVSHKHDIVRSSEYETYHVDWSPDGKFIAYSYGPKFKGKNLKHLLPEFPGVQAPGWNIRVADASKKDCWVQLTFDGQSNKEPDWVYEKEKSAR